MRVLIPKALIPKARLQIRKTGLQLAHTTLVATPLLKLQFWLAINTCITSGYVRNYGGQYVLHSAKNKNSIFQGDFAKKKCKNKKK